MDIQKNRCFYCEELIGQSAKLKPEVDHFVPWARYPNNDLMNLVVAHRDCNAHKRDFLASQQHLSKWWQERVKSASIIADLNVLASQQSWEVGYNRSSSVVTALYGSVHDGTELWVKGGCFESADPSAIQSTLLE